jgi:hypothetical protein
MFEKMMNWKFWQYFKWIFGVVLIVGIVLQLRAFNTVPDYDAQLKKQTVAWLEQRQRELRFVNLKEVPIKNQR